MGTATFRTPRFNFPANKALASHLPSVGKFRERCAMLETLHMQIKERSKEGTKATPLLIGGDMNTLAFPFRYLVPFGTNDLYCSLEEETDALRRK